MKSYVDEGTWIKARRDETGSREVFYKFVCNFGARVK